MSDSEDENVLYAPSKEQLRQQSKSLIGGGARTVNEVLNGPPDKRRLKKTVALCCAFIGLVSREVVGKLINFDQRHSFRVNIYNT